MYIYIYGLRPTQLGLLERHKNNCLNLPLTRGVVVAKTFMGTYPTGCRDTGYNSMRIFCKCTLYML